MERSGRVRAQTVADVSGKTLKNAIRERVGHEARILTDENSANTEIGSEYVGGHESVCHIAREYVRGDVDSNTVEGFVSLVKRSIIGMYQNVSKKHLHRYLAECEFRYNLRDVEDGELVADTILSTGGKRLVYKAPSG